MKLCSKRKRNWRAEQIIMFKLMHLVTMRRYWWCKSEY